MNGEKKEGLEMLPACRGQELFGGRVGYGSEREEEAGRLEDGNE